MENGEKMSRWEKEQGMHGAHKGEKKQQKETMEAKGLGIRRWGELEGKRWECERASKLCYVQEQIPHDKCYPYVYPKGTHTILSWFAK